MGLAFDEEDLLLLGQLVSKPGDVGVAAQCRRVDRPHGVNSDMLKRPLDVIRRLLRVGLLLTLAEWADVAPRQVTVVFDTAVRHLPQNSHAVAVGMTHATMPQVSRNHL